MCFPSHLKWLCKLSGQWFWLGFGMCGNGFSLERCLFQCCPWIKSPAMWWAALPGKPKARGPNSASLGTRGTSLKSLATCSFSNRSRCPGFPSVLRLTHHPEQWIKAQITVASFIRRCACMWRTAGGLTREKECKYLVCFILSLFHYEWPCNPWCRIWILL